MSSSGGGGDGGPRSSITLTLTRGPAGGPTAVPTVTGIGGSGSPVQSGAAAAAYACNTGYSAAGWVFMSLVLGWLVML